MNGKSKIKTAELLKTLLFRITTLNFVWYRAESENVSTYKS